MVQVEFPNCYRCWKGREEFHDCVGDCLDLVETEMHKRRGKVCAVLSETFQGGGSIFPPDGYYQGLVELCKEHDALFIADEVQAGMGRTGKLFAFEHYDVRPHLISLGKGITSGLPLSPPAP